MWLDVFILLFFVASAVFAAYETGRRHAWQKDCAPLLKRYEALVDKMMAKWEAGDE